VFGKLKAVFTMEPVLAIPDIDKEMRVEADALDYAMEGVLSQTSFGHISANSSTIPTVSKRA